MILTKSEELVAVGTALSGGPPRGSVRAALPHTALTEGEERRSGSSGSRRPWISIGIAGCTPPGGVNLSAIPRKMALISIRSFTMTISCDSRNGQLHEKAIQHSRRPPPLAGQLRRGPVALGDAEEDAVAKFARANVARVSSPGNCIHFMHPKL